ncbi:hypothetical protein BS47DRAFT_1382019, partial [Hydnum rufescens UP504]
MGQLHDRLVVISYFSPLPPDLSFYLPLLWRFALHALSFFPCSSVELVPGRSNRYPYELSSCSPVLPPFRLWVGNNICTSEIRRSVDHSLFTRSRPRERTTKEILIVLYGAAPEWFLAAAETLQAAMIVRTPTHPSEGLLLRRYSQVSLYN